MLFYSILFFELYYVVVVVAYREALLTPLFYIHTAVYKSWELFADYIN